MEISKLYTLFLHCNQNIVTDTRKLIPDSIFFALKGNNFNGNLFANQALENGVSHVVIDEKYDDNPNVILVDNVLKTLQDLAHYHRQQLDIPVIAIGGSNGKTTTKELIFKVLSKKYNTFATIGNFNNHIGVPLSILKITPEHEIAVIEMGANHEKEIELLCEIAMPNFGVITNIGLDHLEGFGSLEGVARANSELYYYLLKNKGKAFINTQEEHLSRMAQRLTDKITYPQKNDNFEVELLKSPFFVQCKTKEIDLIETQLFGTYNFNNIATALCIGNYFDVPAQEAANAVSEYTPTNNRSQIIKKNNNVIILDAYNANPSSMELALQNFASIENAKKCVILGDMFELGEASEQEHLKLGKILEESKFDTVILFGEMIQKALVCNPKAYYFTDKFSLHNWLLDKKITDTHILIKGSRGVSLETCVQFL
ncbi:MAG: UDP-N-acetylmuramoyl-tripeptide--D-alanyl-D-alanine ligase [Bacteroidetes bacterium]|nr:MAG: UDP-N-acetylmuramoyl-tripeptide--D-alanyl-D-alanine ligase [Bacteroidota bacterium]TAG87734.1 MAG: UDP-N-acetylmuramoyl-tripeptide--D-alanyl-D-alanine ligase [Bacteroidota bacterium]